MPNMLPVDCITAIDKLDIGPLGVPKLEERVILTESHAGAYAIVRLVVDHPFNGPCVDNRNQVIVSALRGTTTKTIQNAIDAAVAEVARVQGCNSTDGYKNIGSTTAQAFGCRMGSGNGAKYGVIAFISEDGPTASCSRLRALLNTKNNGYDWLYYAEGGQGNDTQAIGAGCD